MEIRELAKQKVKLAKDPDYGVATDRFKQLAIAIDEVRRGVRMSPRTLKLLTAGPAKMAQKVVEEAAEVAIEGALGNREALIHESVDLLYNLSTLWSALGVKPEAVWAEMDRREALLGMAEKLPKTIEDEI
jgi:phosphoribosyl-ATP pyrophosphohydrolase